ncbi:MAG TPA: hypothetical protein VJ874_06370 [Candidatus Thermoplasmatota archaeon]|nr:hypothetical protein [Candidatus Thermoplasmatota archaeon]
MADAPSEDASADADFQRELAARRKDLEREFSDKQRELKAQHQRRMDALRQDQLDWEGHKRQQTKELADRAEKLRTGEERLHKDTHRTVTAKDEAGALRRKVEAMEADRAREAEADAGREGRVVQTEAAARKAKRAARWLALLSLLGPVVWLATAGRAPATMAWTLAGLFLVAAFVVAVSRVDLKD